MCDLAGKVTGIVTDLPIIGGITASGVFLLFISVVGLIGAVRHHQVLLFFYMVILFLIFIIQFSCSCAALSVNDNDQKHIVYNVGEHPSFNIIVTLPLTAGLAGCK